MKPINFLKTYIGEQTAKKTKDFSHEDFMKRLGPSFTTHIA